ncbi:MAG: DUF5989 family protein [Methylococcales bacterium]|nr:DUF5989 family protein [Methylococcales bacterium]
MIKVNKGSFLARKQARAASRELTQMLVLGLGIGFIALGLGCYKYFLVQDANNTLWYFIAWFGGFAILATLIYPFIWFGVEQVLRKLGNWLGHKLMTAILVVVYYAFFWPVGALLRATQGTHPIYGWDGQITPNMQGWHNKELPADIAAAVAQRGSSKKRQIGLFKVLVFFARRGHYFLIPVLIVLVSIGIALFFLQTSVLAPFIYTLF